MEPACASGRRISVAPGYADWNALLIACADRTAAALDEQPGGIAARTWGERNTMRIAHPVSRALPAFAARWLDMPADQLPGDRDMPRVQAPTFGASERFAVAPGDEAHGYFELAGGQSGHPLSPYYGAGHADWAAGKPTPFLPGPAEHTLTHRAARDSAQKKVRRDGGGLRVWKRASPLPARRVHASERRVRNDRLRLVLPPASRTSRRAA